MPSLLYIFVSAAQVAVSSGHKGEAIICLQNALCCRDISLDDRFTIHSIIRAMFSQGAV